MKNKLLVGCMLSAATVLTFANPDFDTRLQNLENDMKAVKTNTVTGTVGAKTALARPEVEGQGYFITFDVLYWQAKVGGTEYAYSDIGNLSSSQTPVSARMREPAFKWDWGFRAGIGANFVHGGWDLLADYTYFKTDANSSVSSGAGGSVVPNIGNNRIVGGDLIFGGAASNYVGWATSQFSLDFDRINLELGRNFFISHNLSFRPHFGLVTAWINQKQTTRFTGLELNNNTVYVKNKCDFWGIGPRTGVQSKWYLTNGFSVFGNVSGAILYGLYQVQYKNWYSAVVSNRINVRGNVHRFAPTAQLQVGFAYDQYISNDKQHIGVTLGWDLQHWWSMNQNFYLNNLNGQGTYNRRNENLGFQGITLHIRWDF